MAKKSTDLRAALSRAEVASKKLANVTDTLNEVIMEAEQAIRALKLGVPGYVSMTTEDEDRHGLFTGLAFRKDGSNAWRLMIESGREGDDDSNLTPLVNTSRDTRLEAVELLPELVEKMVETAEKETLEVEGKIEKVKTFIETLLPELGRGR